MAVKIGREDTIYFEYETRTWRDSVEPIESPNDQLRAIGEWIERAVLVCEGDTRVIINVSVNRTR